jgi:hypothetical protein
LGVFLFVLSSKNLMSSEMPNCPPIPPRSNRNTWYWEYRGVGALGRAHMVLYLWWADVTVPDQTGACRRESCILCPGNRIVAIKGWSLLQGRGSSRGTGDIKGDWLLASSLSSVKPLVSETAQRELWNHYPQH